MIKGSLVALATPLVEESLEVDWQALEKLVSWHVAKGTNGIVAVGTTGESATLSVEEHQRVIRFVVEAAKGRVPVVAGTGANCTREAIALTVAAKNAGADACLLVTPYYNKPSQEGLYQHYKKIAENVDIQQILYNVPGRTACDLETATVARLAEVTNIVGVKDATGDIGRGTALLAAVTSEFAVYSGDDGTAQALMSLGGCGNISVTANIVPAEMSAMCASALSGDVERAKALDAPLRDLHRALFVESNPIPVKWALMRMGLIEDALRLPLTSLERKHWSDVEAAMRSVGIGLK